MSNKVEATFHGAPSRNALQRGRIDPMRIKLQGGSTVEVRDDADGGKVIRMEGPHGIGELRLDAESARQIAQALLPEVEETV